MNVYQVEFHYPGCGAYESYHIVVAESSEQAEKLALELEYQRNKIKQDKPDVCKLVDLTVAGIVLSYDTYR